MEAGFIGLGNLGTVMVQNLIESGRKIHLYNRSREKTVPFEKATTVHPDVASLAQACDVVLSIVSDDGAVKAISLGEAGLVQHLKPGAVHVCLSTIALSTAAYLEQAHREKGLEYVTATIIGRPDAAKTRSLTVCESGTTARKEAVRELLKEIGGKNIYSFGDQAQQAAVVKVCNNFLIIAAIEAMGEAFNLAAKGGTNPSAFYQMITETVFSSPIYKNYGKIIIEETYDQAGFTSQLGLKDTRLALGLAEETGTPLPLGDLVKNRFMVNHNRNRAHYDWTSIAKVIQEESQPEQP